MKIVYGEHCLTPKHGCSPEVILVFLSLQPSWGSVNSSPARVYTVVNNGAILPIQPQHDSLLGQIMSLAVAPDSSHRPAQFCPKLPVARVGKRAEPLRGMRLRDGRTGADNLPTLAPGVARRAQLVQPPPGGWRLRRLWQGALAGRLTRAIDVEDDALAACSIKQLATLPLLAQRARQRIFQKERAQGFDGFRRQSR